MKPDPEKPAYITPGKIALAFVIAGLAIAAVAAFTFLTPAGSVLKTEAGDCTEAAEWHYAEALKATPDAEYHFWAGAAAEKLGATGGTCRGWNGA